MNSFIEQEAPSLRSENSEVDDHPSCGEPPSLSPDDIPNASVVDPEADANQLRASGFCARCVRRLRKDSEHCYTRSNRFRKCDYCAQLKRPCTIVPRSLRQNVRLAVESARDEGFEERIARVSEELEAFGRRHDNVDEQTQAFWSINQNIFRLVNVERVRLGLGRYLLAKKKWRMNFLEGRSLRAVFYLLLDYLDYIFVK